MGNSTIYKINTYHWAQIVAGFALRLAVSEIQRIQGRQNGKCTELTQTELEHLTVQSTLYA